VALLFPPVEFESNLGQAGRMSRRAAANAEPSPVGALEPTYVALFRARSSAFAPSPPPRDTGRAMSQVNVERLREAYEAFKATKQVDIELMTPDVEFVQPDEVGGGRRDRDGGGWCARY
jgi:hypothetical protein